MAVVQRDQDIAGFDVAVNDSLLVCVLHGVTDGDEQLQPLVDGQAILVAELTDRDAAN